jgi:octaprenyl-diphosphate synthase
VQTVSPNVIDRLGVVCASRGPARIAARLRDLQSWIRADMATFEAELESIPFAGSVVHRSARHLLDLGGKHLRPMCVALAAKLGRGFGSSARNLAVSAELMHSATLLHDDVIDLGERRRGGPAPRLVYGDAVSVIAGDWLLVTALKRIRKAGIPGLLDRALGAIEEMIAAEAIQLENRGRVDSDREDYFRVVDGKTAALFRWAMYGGAKAGGLSDAVGRSLERFGTHLGTSFQLVDDLLDFTGESEVTGKALFADLREGKMTYPLLLALERCVGLRSRVEEILDRPADEPPPASLVGPVVDAMVGSGAIRDCLELARWRAREATACLGDLPDGPGRRALTALAEAAVDRRR